MIVSIITLFPETIANHLTSSVLGRALERKLWQLNLIQLREFAINKYGQVDDNLYGGGTGMLLRPEPIEQAVLSLDLQFPNLNTRRYYLSPKGETFNQQIASDLATQVEHLVLLCGHYEGVDQRVLDAYFPQEISLGDFVLTGGEIAAVAVTDAVIRLQPGVLPSDEAHQLESFSCGLLEEPHYTRPAIWQGQEVPAVLLSGHAAKQEAWRKRMRLQTTLNKRPDLLKGKDIDITELQLVFSDN